MTVTKIHDIIVATSFFNWDLYNKNTLKDVIQQTVIKMNYEPDLEIYDKDYKGNKISEEIQILTLED